MGERTKPIQGEMRIRLKLTAALSLAAYAASAAAFFWHRRHH
jgi:hypothetical protein